MRKSPCVGALHDFERLGSAYRDPRDACRAQVVERDGLPRRVAREQLVALDAGTSKTRFQFRRKLSRWRHLEHESATVCWRARFEQRAKIQLDGNAVVVTVQRAAARVGNTEATIGNTVRLSEKSSAGT